jgi:hypothetical protein
MKDSEGHYTDATSDEARRGLSRSSDRPIAILLSLSVHLTKVLSGTASPVVGEST